MGQRRAGGTLSSHVARALEPAIVIVDALLSVVLSPACAACGELLDRPTSSPVCQRCWSSIPLLTPPLCDRCGDPLPSWRTISTAAGLCPRCRRAASAVDRARAIGAYDGALRAIVHALKYEGRRSLARRLAQMMRERGGDILAGADFVVPVPLHAARRRQRGFNQADDLARHLRLPVLRALSRTRATISQTGLSAAERRRNTKDAFAPTRRASRVGGRIVVLIDDVSTTGATLDACAAALKAAGAREVRALTAARVVGGAATTSARTTGPNGSGARNP